MKSVWISFALALPLAPSCAFATPDQKPEIHVKPFNYVDTGVMLEPVQTTPTVGSEVRRGVAVAIQCYSGIGHIDVITAHEKIAVLNDCVRMARLSNLSANARTPRPFELGLYYGTWSYLSGVLAIKALADPQGDVAQYARSYYNQYSVERTLLNLTDEQVANSASVGVNQMINRLSEWASRQRPTLTSK